MAHIGAWEAIREAGLGPAGIIGTSIGGLIGALAASGMPPEHMRHRALGLERGDIVRLNRRAAWINGIRQLSVFRGDVLRDHLAGLLPPDGWDALEIPLRVSAVDLASGQTVWFGDDDAPNVSLLDAVYASSALPVLYPPLELVGAELGRSGPPVEGDIAERHGDDGRARRVLVDGGVTGTLPIERARTEGATEIIAVDVGSGEDAKLDEVLGGGMVAVHQRVVSIMAWQRRSDLVERWDGPPLRYVRPSLAGYGTFDFEHVAYFLDEGYRATKEMLAARGG